MKVLQAIALFTADLEDEDIPQHVRGKLMGLNRVESETGGLSRLVATIQLSKAQKIDVVINAQSELTKQNIQLGDEVTLDTDRRVVDGKQLLFAVDLKRSALPPQAQRD